MDRLFEKNSCKKTYIIYLIIMAVGALFFISPSFHSAIWFDEAYTVGLVKHSFIDIIKVSTFDVHPYLYYIMLKIFTLIFGTSIIAMRVFSSIGGILLASLGFTHIRRDFGDKVGIYYTVLCFLMPVVLKYSQQIRMYSWAQYFLLLACIYAYRYIKNECKDNLVKFILFSVLASYVHYFAFFTCLLIDLFLFIYYLRRKELKARFIKIAIYQLIFYSVGLVVFVIQLIGGGAGWLSMQKDIWFEIIAFNFVGEISKDTYYSGRLLYAISLFGAFVLAFIGIAVYKMYLKSKEKAYPVLLAIALYFGVIAITMIISLIKPVFYPRYMSVMVGIFVFIIAYVLSELPRQFRYVKYAFFVILLVCCVMRAVEIYKISYNKTSNVVKEYTEENIKENDLILVDENLRINFSVNSMKSVTVMYNPHNWRVAKAYGAFDKESYVVVTDEELMKYISSGKQRIFVIGDEYCEKMVEQSGLYELERKDEIKQDYYSGEFGVAVYRLK